MNYTKKQALYATLSDCKHDFSSYCKLKLVKDITPDVEDKHGLSEDHFVSMTLTNSDPDKSNWDEIKDNFKKIKILMNHDDVDDRNTEINKLIDESIKDKYIINSGKWVLGKLSDKNDRYNGRDYGASVIQGILHKNHIYNDIFIICDVAHRLRDDLSFIGNKRKGLNTENKNMYLKECGQLTEDEFNNIKNSNQKFFWLQTPHTLLDPAGKSHLKGHAGVGWKEKNSNFHFAFQNMEPGKKLSYDYLEWEEKKTQYDLNNIVDRTRAICMNRRAHLITSTNKKYPHDYTKHKANLFIQVLDKDGKWKGNYTYATKELTEIRTKVMKKSQILSYVKKGSELLFNFAKKLIHGTTTTTTTTTTKTTIEEYSHEYHLLGKRFGDMPQALSCLQEQIPYCYYEGNNIIRSEASNKNDRTALLSNGNHMFVTYDRIAFAQAINYGAPYVLYDNSQGENFLLFIRRDMASSENIKDYINTKIANLNDQLENIESIKYLIINDYFYSDYDENKVDLLSNLKKLLMLDFTEAFVTTGHKYATINWSSSLKPRTVKANTKIHGKTESIRLLLALLYLELPDIIQFTHNKKIYNTYKENEKINQEYWKEQLQRAKKLNDDNDDDDKINKIINKIINETENYINFMKGIDLITSNPKARDSIYNLTNKLSEIVDSSRRNENFLNDIREHILESTKRKQGLFEYLTQLSFLKLITYKSCRTRNRKYDKGKKLREWFTKMKTGEQQGNYEDIEQIKQEVKLNENACYDVINNTMAINTLILPIANMILSIEDENKNCINLYQKQINYIFEGIKYADNTTDVMFTNLCIDTGLKIIKREISKMSITKKEEEKKEKEEKEKEENKINEIVQNKNNINNRRIQ